MTNAVPSEPCRPPVFPACQPSPVSRASLARQAALVTPARIFAGRAGTSYLTSTALRLRADHAAARDAVTSELDISTAAIAQLTGGRGAALVTTLATSRSEFIQRPDRGRRLSPSGLSALGQLSGAADLQLVLGDGLSSRALTEQAPALVEALHAGSRQRGWSVGNLIGVTNCRVGVLNDIGHSLGAAVVVLLIGERPGLATASSLSAYLGYRPEPGHDDSNRNLVSNIHPRGLSTTLAADRILRLADAMRAFETSGVAIKEAEPRTVASSTVAALPGSGRA